MLKDFLRCLTAVLWGGMAVSGVTAMAGEPVAGSDVAHAVDLAGSGPWDISYDDEVCHLSRAFGTGDDQVVVRLTRHGPGDGFDLLLASKLLQPVRSIVFMRMAFGEAKPFEVRPLNVEDGALPLVLLGGHALVHYDPGKLALARKTFGMATQVTPQDEAGVKSISFAGPSGRWYRLRTGSMGPPMKAMRDCMDDLIRHWGYDPAQQGALSVPAKPFGVESWLSGSDYPAGFAKESESAAVIYRLDIDEHGKVLTCHIQAAAGSEEFRKITCEALMRRAKYHPALDAAGQPTRSFDVGTIHWVGHL